MTAYGTTLTVDEKGDDEDDFTAKLEGMKAQKRWVQEIKFYESKSKQWEEKSKKILRRYKDDRSPREQKVPRFNILWSNIQTLTPALYSRRPKPDIERRFRDKDDLGRISSTVLERAISYFIDEKFDEAIRAAVVDRLLPGRGTVWVRYEPHFKDASYNENEEVADEGLEITDDVTSYGDKPEVGESEDAGGDQTEPGEILSDEVLCYDYVHWQDFGHTFGRTWEEIDAPWRKVYLTREELVRRFGDKGKKIVLDYSPHDLKDNKEDEVEKKATIYEIWCKSEKKVYWIHKDFLEGPLDVKDDPLGLQDFFPFPKPLFATLANDTCIPVPDYQEYQDQANELDELTSRIGAITRAVKVAGIYDASAAGVERLLAEGIENQLIPVNQYAVLAEKGGLKGVMELMPMQEILQTLLGLYEARDKVKSDLYEITGIADILRGASDANETATAQQIKSQFGTLRLSANQDDVQRFARDLVKIGTEIIANHFSLDTIKKICGVPLFTAQEKQIVIMRQQALQKIKQLQPPPQQPPQQGQPAQAQQQPVQPQQQLMVQQALQHLPPLPPDAQQMDQETLEEMMENPTWEDVYALLKDEITLSYKIDIETDSTIKFDQDAERDARVQFLDATGKFLSAAMQNTNPDLAPLLGKLLMFGVRGFKVGKDLESTFENTIRKLEKDAANPQQKPDPEMAKAQAQIAIQKAQFDADQQMEQMRMQAEREKIQLEMQREQQQGQIDNANDMAKAKLDAETKIVVAQIQAKTSLKQAGMSAGKELKSTDYPPELAHTDIGDGDTGPNLEDLIKTVVTQMQQTLGGMQQSHQALMQSHQALAQAMTRPKQVLRDENGNIVGIH